MFSLTILLSFSPSVWLTPLRIETEHRDFGKSSRGAHAINLLLAVFARWMSLDTFASLDPFSFSRTADAFFFNLIKLFIRDVRQIENPKNLKLCRDVVTVMVIM